MRTLYKIIIVLAILFVSFEIGIAIPGIIDQNEKTVLKQGKKFLE